MSDNIISLEQITHNINNVNLNEEVVVFDHTSFRKNNEPFPIRVDALMICIVTEGECRLGIDLNEYNVSKNSIFVIQPRNYVSNLSYSENFRCTIVACSLRVAEDVLPKLSDIMPWLVKHRVKPVIKFSDEEAQSFLQFIKFLKEKMRGPKTPFLKQKILSILQAIFYEMMDMNFSNTTDKEVPTRTRKEELMAKFIIEVSENFKKERQVSYYAEKLFITPKHLSSVVKEIAGVTAGDLIEHYVILEAKMLLKKSDMTIQEIATSLNFSNQSFFGKYFKHVIGVSPTVYRKQDFISESHKK